jgi:metal-sulfur cluster biosynthetic enzyme
VQPSGDDNHTVVIFISILVLVLVGAGIVIGVRKQAALTQSITLQEREKDARILAQSAKIVEATVAEELAKKARDPKLATMTQEDLVFEVLKECFDPEIPLNIVDLGLVYAVKVHPDTVNVQMSMTSPQCPSHVGIREDVKNKLTDAGFPNPQIDLVWEPAWSPQRISEAGRKKLGI